MKHAFAIPSDPKQAARTRAALAKVVRFDGRVLTIGQLLLTYPLTHRSHYVRHYARHKTCGEYKRIKPTHEYTVWCIGGSGVSVPKLVFDALSHLPTKEAEQPVFEDRPRGHVVHLRPF